jgi:hypothetical protein
MGSAGSALNYLVLYTFPLQSSVIALKQRMRFARDTAVVIVAGAVLAAPMYFVTLWLGETLLTRLVSGLAVMAR